jgi:hypothetical protein
MKSTSRIANARPGAAPLQSQFGRRYTATMRYSACDGVTMKAQLLRCTGTAAQCSSASIAAPPPPPPRKISFLLSRDTRTSGLVMMVWPPHTRARVHAPAMMACQRVRGDAAAASEVSVAVES